MTKRTTPGLKRLRASPNAETIRSAVLSDQQTGRSEALARIEAAKAADADPIDLPAAFVLGAPQMAADADFGRVGPGRPTDGGNGRQRPP